MKNGKHTNGKHVANGTAALIDLVPVADLMPSLLNPRKTFDQAELEDLAQSLKGLGMLQPILARPSGMRGGPKYEIADGERRFRGAQIAGLVEVPVIVRVLTDRQMLEIMIVSFEQRADVSPGEKAAGYKRLIDHGATVEEIAAQVGKSVSQIRGVLKLLALPQIAAEALAAGEIPASVAERIARVPGEAGRHRVALQVLLGSQFVRGSDKEMAKLIAKKRSEGDLDPLSYRDTAELIERNYMRELKGAPFDRAAADLLPEAGSCAACPKRTGNDTESFPGARANVCTDTDCYARKVEAHGRQVLARAREAGKAVLQGKAAKDLFHAFGDRCELQYGCGYVELDARCNADNKNRTYRQLVGASLAEEVAVAVDPRGAVHELLPAKKAQAALRKQHKIGMPDQRSRTSDRPRESPAERAKRESEEAAWKAAGVAAVAAVRTEARSRFAGVVGVGPKAIGALRVTLIHSELAYYPGADEILERLAPGGRKVSGPGTAWSQALKGLESFADLAAIQTELIAAQFAEGWSRTWDKPGPDGDGRDGETEFWKEFGIDPQALFRKAQSAPSLPAGSDAAAVLEQAAGDESSPVVKRRLNGMANDLRGHDRGGKLKLGARVYLVSDPERLGTLTCISERAAPGEIKTHFVEWDQRGRKKLPSDWNDPATLALASAAEASAPTAASEPAWRSRSIGMEMDLPIGDVNRLMAEGIKTLGQLADRIAAGDKCGLKAKPLKEISKAIEIYRSDAEDKPSAIERAAAAQTTDEEWDREMEEASR